jgi:hypothetical protein
LEWRYIYCEKIFWNGLMVKLKKERIKSTFKETASVTVNNKIRRCEKNLKKM